MSESGDCYVYAIINRVNGKTYVGQTTRTPMIRFLEHANPAKRGKKSSIARAILKEGKQNFCIRVLDICTREKLDEREKFWIWQLQAWKAKHGYNRTMGGQDKAIVPIVRKRRRACRRPRSPG